MGFLLLTGALNEDVPPPPPPRTLTQEGQAQIDADTALAPQRLALSQQYDPEYAKIQTDIIGQSLDRIAPTINRVSQEATTAQRSADIADVEQLGPRAIAAFKAANPELAGLLDEFSKQAQSELAAGTSLTPDLRREVEQSIRAGQSARGMGFGNSDLLQEAMTSGAAGLALQDRRRKFAADVAGMQSGIANVPFQQILGRNVVSLPMTQTFGNQAAGQTMAQAPNFDPFNGYNSDLQNTNYNQGWSARIAVQNYNQAITGALIGAIGSIVGGGARGAAGGV